MRHKPIFLFITLSIYVLINSSFSQDTSLTVSSDGKVGIGITNPEVKLHINGGLQLDKSGPELDRLILRTVSENDPGRYGILFSNNKLAPFLGDDIGDQNYSFYSTWGNTRMYDAILQIHGKANGSWGNVLQLTHNGTDGYISTDTGNLIINPADGSSNVGIDVSSPEEKLQVNGMVYSSDGGFKFPDGSVQTTAAGDRSSNFTEFGHLNQGYVMVTTTLTELNTSGGGDHTFTKNYSDSKIEVIVNSRVKVESFTIQNGGIWITPYIDDSVSPDFGNDGSIRYTNLEDVIFINAVFEDLQPGQHTISLWAKTNSGEATNVIVDPGNWNAKIIVKETW